MNPVKMQKFSYPNNGYYDDERVSRYLDNTDQNGHLKMEPMDPITADLEMCASNGLPPAKMPNYLRDPILNKIYAIGRVLGKGGFAWCYEAHDTKDNSCYALKVISKAHAIKSNHRNKVLREIAIHYPLRNENIVRLYSAFEDDENIYMVLELCPMESLIHLMKNNRTLLEPEARYFLHQLLLGIRYLHEEAKILHRDLKLGNMLLSDDMKVKIADFGLAADMDPSSKENMGHVCGTPNYIAPEVLRREGHLPASDMWAVGCILFAMLMGKPPFETVSLKTTYDLILDCKYSFPYKCNINRSARDLIRSLLHPMPHCRPTASQAFGHEFFKVAIPNGIMAKHDLPRFRKSHHCKPSLRNSNNQNGLPHTCSSPAIKDRRNQNLTQSRFHDTNQQTRFVINATNGSPNNNSPDSGFNSVICALDSLGNVSFGPNRKATLIKAMEKYQCALSKILQESMNPNQVIQAFHTIHADLIYITKWIDYSNRYGFGCQYSNSGVCIFQNDNTRLCLSPDRRHCRRWKQANDNSALCWPSDIFDLIEDRSLLGESVDMLTHFVHYMDANLRAGSIHDTALPNISMAVPFMVTWRRYFDSIVFLLSDGTFQVNFFEHHTKIVLSQMTNLTGLPTLALTFIDDTRIARTYPFSSTIRTAVSDQILRRICQLLSDISLTSDGDFLNIGTCI